MRRPTSGVRDVWLRCDRWPDARDLASWARDVFRIEAAQTPQEQAIALYRWALICVGRNGPPAHEGERGREAYLMDTLKYLTVYGAHYCDGLSRVMINAWQAAGGRARKVVICRLGHTIAELRYRDADGSTRWHAFDPQHGWYVFARDGAAVASRSPFLLEGRYFDVIGRGTDGWLFVDDVRPPDARGRVRAERQLARASMYAEPAQILFSLPGEVHVQSGPGWSTGHFLDGDPSIGVAGDGRIYYSHPTDYRVTVYSEAGDPVRVIRRRVERRAIPGSIEDSIRSVARASLGEIQPSVPPDRRQIERIVQEALPSPGRDSLPALDLVLVSRDGSFWVRRAAEYPDPAARAVAGAFGYIERAWLDRWRSRPTFDLFEPDGTYRGSVVLPSRFVPMTVVGDTVFGVLHDELDVEYVVALTARNDGPEAEG